MNEARIDHSATAARVKIPPPGFWIGGRWVEAEQQKRLPVVDPSTGEEFATIAEAGAEEVERAVAAARNAYESYWRKSSSAERRRVLLRLAELAEAHKEELALLESLDVGMIHSLARRFAARSLARNFEYYASWCDKLYGSVVPLPGAEAALDYVRREPYGVVAAITAWNTPLVFLGSKVAPALATGNTVVVKPSELGSLSILRFAELCTEADLPPGLVNVITGGPATAQHLLRHPGVDKVSFTGGSATGKLVMGACAATLKHVTLELGGKSPQLVFADADLDRAVPGVALGGLALSGQACAAGTRVLVAQSIFAEFAERLCKMVQGLPIGDPLRPETVLGPLISETHLQRVQGYLQLAEAQCAQWLMRGQRLGGELSRGYFLSPTLLAGVDPNSRLAQEEIFGPVLLLFPFHDEAEAIVRANATRYGLAAGVWSADLARAQRVASALRAGVVWINAYGTLPYTVPFGGWGESGFGREAGREALWEYTQPKNIYVDLQG